MNRRTLTLLAITLAIVPVLVFAGDKKNKKSVPAIFGTATYVYVQAEDGDAYKPGLLDEDRQAVFNVEAALRKWNRYTLTVSRDEAELIFFVRKGRMASATLGGTVGTPGQGPLPGQPRPGMGGAGVGVGGEAGPPDDLLEVRMRYGDRQLSAPIWIRSQPDGLVAPRVPLVQALKDAVERDYPK